MVEKMIRFIGTDNSMVDIPISKFGRYRKKPVVIRAKKINEKFKVKTKEGTMSGKKGDFLLVGVENEVYPCDSHIFRKSYQKVKP